MRKNSALRIIGFGIFFYGAGILTSFILPDRFLAVIEAVIIIGMGMIYYSRR